MVRYEFRRQVTETVAVLMSRRVIAGWLMVCVFTVIAGPFGTFDTMALGWRAVHWGTIIAAGLWIGAFVNAALLALRLGWSPLQLDLVASLLITCLLAPLILSLRAGLNRNLESGDLSFGAIWGTTLIFVAPIFFLRRQLTGLRNTAQAPPPRLARRLPAPVCEGTILRLCARGHVVEVVTDRGSTMLRMRLSDAIDEMYPVDGLWTHRSHWVARAAIDGHVCEAGKLRLTLVNGDHVPVSRGFRPQLETERLVPRNDRRA